MITQFKSGLVPVAALAVITFLYFPLIIIVLYSFNADSVSAFPIQSYSLGWYSVMLQNDSLLAAVKNSITVAIVATTLALIVGLPAAYAMHKYDFLGKKTLERIVLMPITLPGIVTGVAMLSFFPLVGVRLSLTAVTIGHITFLSAIMITQLLARFKQLDPFLEQAGYDLGARPLRVFFVVIIPNVKTAIIGAVLLCLVLSMDEIPVTFFLIARENTLPIEIYGMMRRGITPEVNAISTLVFTVSAIAILLSIRLTEQNQKIPK
ncbi:MAG: ABC transporter permease [Cyclobacteriaceae bacterium]|nr:ABC transporter permease [Cyclobacteriaceae bacterium HetDA_MAG_MS6]